MIESIPHSLGDLAEKNIKTLNGLMVDVKRLEKDAEYSQKVGNEFMENVYPGYSEKNPMVTIIHDKNITALTDLIAKHDIGMLLIRPEMYHNKGKIMDFLRDRNYKVVYEDELSISPEAYFALYKHVFAIDTARPALPTRTAVYINSPSFFVVFKDPEGRFSNLGQSLANGFVDLHKGKPGVRNTETLRGSCVYNEAVRLGFDKLNNSQIAFATDPFWSFRHIVNDDRGKSHYHLLLGVDKDKALLVYNAEGVHLPNGNELKRDLVAVNSVDQLLAIYNVLEAI